MDAERRRAIQKMANELGLSVDVVEVGDQRSGRPTFAELSRMYDESVQLVGKLQGAKEAAEADRDRLQQAIRNVVSDLRDDSWVEGHTASTQRAEALSDAADKLEALLTPAAVSPLGDPICEHGTSYEPQMDWRKRAEAAEADRDRLQQAIRPIIEAMRAEGPRYKSHDLGFVDSVSSSNVDAWADELDALLTPAAVSLEAK